VIWMLDYVLCCYRVWPGNVLIITGYCWRYGGI
jgi:hypothetical protein